MSGSSPPLDVLPYPPDDFIQAAAVGVFFRWASRPQTPPPPSAPSGLAGRAYQLALLVCMLRSPGDRRRLLAAPEAPVMQASCRWPRLLRDDG